jgi:hypothetical protein
MAGCSSESAAQGAFSGRWQGWRCESSGELSVTTRASKKRGSREAPPVRTALGSILLQWRVEELTVLLCSCADKQSSNSAASTMPSRHFNAMTSICACAHGKPDIRWVSTPPHSSATWGWAECVRLIRIRWDPRLERIWRIIYDRYGKHIANGYFAARVAEASNPQPVKEDPQSRNHARKNQVTAPREEAAATASR